MTTTFEDKEKKLTLKNIYNKVAGQAWSMFDGEVEDKDEFESSLLSSIQKALTELWCSYPFPFRIKVHNIDTITGIKNYDLPNGNILQRKIDGSQRFCVRLIGGNYLEYIYDYSTLDDKQGEPNGFYVKNDKICFYPCPEKEYKVEIEYLTLEVGKNINGEPIFDLVDDDDFIDIPDKYEKIFENALITKSMVYAIASKIDENYAGYEEQFENAYKILIRYCRGLNINSRISW